MMKQLTSPRHSAVFDWYSSYCSQQLGSKNRQKELLSLSALIPPWAMICCGPRLTSTSVVTNLRLRFWHRFAITYRIHQFHILALATTALVGAQRTQNLRSSLQSIVSYS